MDVDWRGIDHITKVDPEKPLPAEPSILAGTDLVMVGGSDGVTEANTLETVAAIREAAPDVAIFQEPYDDAQVTLETVEAVDAVAVPAVYNGDADHFVGKHLGMYTELATSPTSILGANLPLVGSVIESKGRAAVAEMTEKIVPEGYVIQNLESAAAVTAGVSEVFSTDQVAGAALATETFYDFPIFYVEYSGTYGGPEDVAAAADQLEETVLLYGGGIDSQERATTILEAGADAIVVGDCYHENPDRFVETIPG